jgi:hypothetical protein
MDWMAANCDLALRDDAFKPHLAGMGEDGRAVAFHMFVEPDAWAGLGQHHFQRGLAALQRIRSEIVAVQFDQIEGIEENAFVMVAVANAIK